MIQNLWLGRGDGEGGVGQENFTSKMQGFGKVTV